MKLPLIRFANAQHLPPRGKAFLMQFLLRLPLGGKLSTKLTDEGCNLFSAIKNNIGYETAPHPLRKSSAPSSEGEGFFNAVSFKASPWGEAVNKVD